MLQTGRDMGGGNQEELDISLDQLHSLKRDEEDNDSFCGIFLNFVNNEMSYEYVFSTADLLVT